ncbi:serine/threonine-protein kinase [Chondromyces apiculatus]|uniref:serine/threonine-protein kinase n=1 Tax=Chondromyces apiculatus TaxID=51 RepID=UPI000693E0FF|nr:serine/threonine-protein kinase [Chondromyces apiculatus]
MPNKAKIPVGTLLAGKHRITREIGRGGMAAVYEAENVDIGKRVAIKVLAQELTTSAVVVERFLREARAAAAIRSPYICDVYDSGRLEDGRPFLVLELLEGESLYERMTVVRNLDLETTVAVVMQVCRGLSKAHAASIVHRDLKPENIFLTHDEENRLLAKILDFGLAKFYAPMDGGGDNKQARLTREGAVFGTPAYMSPEQVRGQGAVDHRADLWALGCITYECLTGRTVWQTDQGVAMTFAQIANAPLPRPAEFRPDLPQSFTLWFDRALNRSIEKRYQTAKEFADELAIALGVSPSGRGAEAAVGTPSLDDIPVELHAREESQDSVVTISAPLSALIQQSQASMPALERRVPPDGPSSPGALPSGNPGLAFVGPPAGAAPGQPGGAMPLPRSEIETTLSPRRRGSSVGRVVLALFVLGLLGGAAYLGYQEFAQPQAALPPSASSKPSAASMASATPTAEPSVVRDTPSAPMGDAPWIPLLSSAQEEIAKGNVKEAFPMMKEAFDKGAHGVPRTMLEHLQVAMRDAGGKAPCGLTGLGRPRTYDLVSRGVRAVPGSRPSIAVGPRGAVMAWTDAHEGSEHAYAVSLDSALRPTSAAVDVTPEGYAVGRPDLKRVGDRFVLTYWDAKGPEAGVHVRWLDANGRIAGPAVAAASIPRGGNFWPSLAASPEGFFVVWSDEGDANSDSEDLFLRRLSPALEPVGQPVRLTDVAPAGPVKPRARFPSIAVHGDAIHIVFRLEREPLHTIHHMRLPIADAGKSVEPAARGERVDRMAGEVALANTEKSRSDGPGISCSADACYLVWHGDPPIGGASAAYVDPAAAQPLWRKKFVKVGMHPAVSVDAEGRAQIVWFEGSRVATAALTRDGVGPATRFARVSGDQPMPSIAPGTKPGEWYIAWLDYEAGHLEPYAARVQCR